MGTVCGLLLGGTLAAWRNPQIRQVAATPLREDGGHITRVVMHYQPDAGPLVAPIYAQFLMAIGKQVEVVWVVSKAADLNDLRARLGAAWPAERGRCIVVGKAISTWAKDRCVAMTTQGGASVLCAPARTRTANPLRTNDQEVPYRLAQESALHMGVRGTDADFDGGDFLATERHLFAGPAIIEKNVSGAGSRFRGATQCIDHLTRALGREITWLGTPSQDAPPHHLGMFLTVIGNSAAVGDVRLAEQVVAAHPELLAALQSAGGEATSVFRTELTTRLDCVARQLHSLGYRVVRVPLLPSATPRAWMSYNNGIVETRGGTVVFYMPTFGAPPLDRAAASIYRNALHCTVIPIDCAKIWHLGGSLHCLVNVVARRDGE